MQRCDVKCLIRGGLQLVAGINKPANINRAANMNRAHLEEHNCALEPDSDVGFLPFAFLGRKVETLEVWKVNWQRGRREAGGGGETPLLGSLWGGE